jgi:hypothetical protein
MLRIYLAQNATRAKLRTERTSRADYCSSYLGRCSQCVGRSVAPEMRAATHRASRRGEQHVLSKQQTRMIELHARWRLRAQTREETQAFRERPCAALHPHASPHDFAQFPSRILLRQCDSARPA